MKKLGWLISGAVASQELDSNVSHAYLAIAMQGPSSLEGMF